MRLFFINFFAFSLFFSGMDAKEGPREKVLMTLSGDWISRGLYAAAKLEIADHLLSGPKHISELSELTTSNDESLYRLLHMLASFGFFKEEPLEIFSNTETTLLLSKTNPDSLQSLTIFYGEEIRAAFNELVPSIKANVPAFELTYEEPVFSYFKKNPERAFLFQEAMKQKSKAVISSALSSYRFDQFKTIYDIGGGNGQFMQALLTKFPHLKGILFELPEVVEKIKMNIPGCKIISGDFFNSIPKGGEAYLLKSVIHDWDDEKALIILKNCYKAMAREARLLIIEVVLLPKDQSLYANCMDTLMMTVTGGKERSLSCFKELFEKAGFTLESVTPTDTEFSILELKKT